MIKKIATIQGKYFNWKQGDLQTHKGILKEEDLKSKNNQITSSTGKEFTVFEPNFNDLVRKQKKGPQTMMLKDISHIIVEAGITKDSKVLEAGSGSGRLTVYLAKYAKEVISYDINEQHQTIAKKNVEELGFKNVKFQIQDVNEKIEEENLDTIILDLNQPENLENSYNALKFGGYLIAYLPNMTQVIEFVKQAEKHFLIEQVKDIIEMPWHVSGRKAKPQPKDSMHTAFLIFCRKA